MKLFTIFQRKQFNKEDLALAVLQIKGPTNTSELKALGIDKPGVVIRTLRDQGYEIETKLVVATNSDGKLRRNMAEYSLSPSNKATGGNNE